MGEHNGSFPVDRGISGEVKVVRSRLRWVAMVTSGLGLLLGTMYGFMVLMQPRSVLMFMASTNTTKG